MSQTEHFTGGMSWCHDLMNKWRPGLQSKNLGGNKGLQKGMSLSCSEDSHLIRPHKHPTIWSQRRWFFKAQRRSQGHLCAVSPTESALLPCSVMWVDSNQADYLRIHCQEPHLVIQTAEPENTKSTDNHFLDGFMDVPRTERIFPKVIEVAKWPSVLLWVHQ